MITKKISVYTDLYAFLIIIATLILIGLLFVYSSSYVYALELFNNPLFFVKRQLFGICVGLIALSIGRSIPLYLIKKNAFFLFICSIAITSLTYVSSFSRTIHGSSRWIWLGPISFQPSELIKIGLLFYSARFFEKKLLQTKVSHSQIVIFGLSLAIMCLILLKQPDFGITVTLLLTTLGLFFITHKNMKHIFITFFSLVVSAFGLIAFRPYRLQRIIIFLNPWQDPKGAGFQIIQSLVAIGSGKWFGMGIGHSRQKFFYLPMQHTDFIFSIIAEETGFFGIFFLISLFALLLYFGIKIAHQLHNYFYSLVIISFVLLITLQAVINMAVVTGLVPTKGIGLPFVSYGNTSLVCYLFMIGIIINMIHSHNKVVS